MHAQSCPTVCDPMDGSLLGSSVHGILQARIPEWTANPAPRNPPDPGIEPASLTPSTLASRFFTANTTWEAPKSWHSSLTDAEVVIWLPGMSAVEVLGPSLSLCVQGLQKKYHRLGNLNKDFFLTDLEAEKLKIKKLTTSCLLGAHLSTGSHLPVSSPGRRGRESSLSSFLPGKIPTVHRAAQI